MAGKTPTLAPLLNVRGGAQAVAFYKAAFGAEEIFVLDNEGGVVAHLSIGGAEFCWRMSRRNTRTPAPARWVGARRG